MTANSNIGIGVNAWVWTSPFADADMLLVEKAVAMGFDAFTVPIEDPGDFNAHSLAAFVHDLPIRINVTGAYPAHRDLTHDDPKIRQNSLEYIRRCVEICEILGAPILGGPAYSAVGKCRRVSPDQRKLEWQRVVEGLSRAGEIAANHGVVLAVEALNRFETDLVNTAAQLKQLIIDVGSSHVKMHLDTFHMHIEEDSLYEAILLAGEDLVYVDASESHRGTPGQGLVNWQDVALGLHEIGYAGDCVIESFTPECEIIAEAAAIWRPLAPSQDLLASEGCKFLRSVL